MRVALVCDWYRPRVGGIELHLHDLARHLIAAGHTVEVITTTPGESVDDGIRVHRIDARRLPSFHVAWNPGSMRAIGDCISNGRYDVVHAHVSIVSPVAIAGAMHAQRLNVPTVVTFHSVVPLMRLLATAANAVLGVSHWRARYSAVSERVARDVQPLAGRSPITVLPNGIDAGAWRNAPARRVQDDGVVRLVSTMRLNAKKRPFALLDLMAELRRMSLPDVHLFIAGDGPRRLRLAREIERRALEGHVTLLGQRSRAELRDLYTKCDLFVLPTVRESFGLAALEARAAGLPVVAMARSGVAEVIAHEREGLLATSDADFARQVARLITDRSLRDRIAADNRGAPPLNDWPMVVAAHEMIYGEAVALMAPRTDFAPTTR